MHSISQMKRIKIITINVHGQIHQQKYESLLYEPKGNYLIIYKLSILKKNKQAISR